MAASQADVDLVNRRLDRLERHMARLQKLLSPDPEYWDEPSP